MPLIQYSTGSAWTIVDHEVYSPEEIKCAWDELYFSKWVSLDGLLAKLKEYRQRIMESVIITSTSTGPTEIAP